MRICLLAQTLGYPEGGGHFWVYLNWALGFFRNGAEVTWMETVSAEISPEVFHERRRKLEQRLRSYGLPVQTAFVHECGTDLGELYQGGLKLAEVGESHDLLVNFRYGLPELVTRLFRWKALVDIDPGLLQYWVHSGCFAIAPHDAYFSISTEIGRGTISDLGLTWWHTPPCVDTSSWPVTRSRPEACFTTVTHWYAREYVKEPDGSFYDNTKRAAFEPFLGLPILIKAKVELALCHDPKDEPEWERLRRLGWQLRTSESVAESPATYRAYIQEARGEFSACKASYVKMQTGWLSDRTLCFLASGKPAIVQDTGPLSYFENKGGLLRFRDMAEAVRAFERVDEHYQEQAQAARDLAERVFDARIVTKKFLEKVFQ